MPRQFISATDPVRRLLDCTVHTNFVKLEYLQRNLIIVYDEFGTERFEIQTSAKRNFERSGQGSKRETAEIGRNEIGNKAKAPYRLELILVRLVVAGCLRFVGSFNWWSYYPQGYSVRKAAL